MTTTRTVRLLRDADPAINLPGAFLITTKDTSDVYRFTAVAGGFKVEKFGEDKVYTVRIGKGASCGDNCKGWKNYGYCRHVQSLTALKNAGKI